MGKLKVIKAGPMATIQDAGRFGYRKFGIPQSGAMDLSSMHSVNRLVGNDLNWPVIEFALMGMKMEALEATTIGVTGADLKVNGKLIAAQYARVDSGDVIEIGSPRQVYAYFAIEGKLRAQEDFGSVSTYLLAGFGGIDGRSLRPGDELITDGIGIGPIREENPLKKENVSEIRIMHGPEWRHLEDALEAKIFKIDPSSNRMGIRLHGSSIKCNIGEIQSSAVVPGTIQLPPNGLPIVLMNDCQTTGGYPRIGKVLDEDLGKLAQVRAGNQVKFKIV